MQFNSVFINLYVMQVVVNVGSCSKPLAELSWAATDVWILTNSTQPFCFFHVPPCRPHTHHLRQFIRLLTAPSRATKGFRQLFSHMQWYSLRPANRLWCVKSVEFLFWSPFSWSAMFVYSVQVCADSGASRRSCGLFHLHSVQLWELCCGRLSAEWLSWGWTWRPVGGDRCSFIKILYI